MKMQDYQQFFQKNRVMKESSYGGDGLGIKDFYRDKTIFLTGCTGFVGKVLLEKIIRTFPDFRKIFVMIRAKKNMSLEERFVKSIFSSEIFTQLFRKNPGLR